MNRGEWQVLDMSAGNRAVWIDKSYKEAVYVDIRPSVNPDIVADSRNLPFASGQGFSLVVFDPPHVNFGANSNMSRNYGHHTTEEIRDIIKRSAQEAWRVSAPNAMMAFKWNDHTQKLSKVLALMEEWWEPLFGHVTSVRTMRNNQTYWVMLRRR